MAVLSQLDLRHHAARWQLRSLIEDVVEEHQGIYPEFPLALAVWHQINPASDEQHLLEVFSGENHKGIASVRFSLAWKTGREIPPYVNIQSMSLDNLSHLIQTQNPELTQFLRDSEVIYFNRDLLPSTVTEAFKVKIFPPGFIRAWYIPADEFRNTNAPALWAKFRNARAGVGLVKFDESPDRQACKAIAQVEISQRWVPISARAVATYSFYIDVDLGAPGYWLLDGGAAYQILRYEVQFAPDLARMLQLVEPACDARYPVLYLRAMPPSS